jgi:hypothetical protein
MHFSAVSFDLSRRQIVNMVLFAFLAFCDRPLHVVFNAAEGTCSLLRG